MAKSQNVSLTPSEITGICGRLRCCLAYEHEMYEEARKLLPKVKKTIQTPLGEGKVNQVLPMSDSVLVYIPDVGQRVITRSELESGKMDEKQPVARVSEPEDSDTPEDVEMVRFDNIGRPPRSEERQPSNQRENSRQVKERSIQFKAKDQSSGTTEGKEANSEAQKNAVSNRSNSRRNRRGPRSGKRVKENGNKSNPSS